MSKIMRLPAAGRERMPWKNGGGTTCEVAAYPPGSGMEDFLWRISIAEVAQAGLFSSFSNVDRILTVLDGMLRLKFERDQFFLTSRDAPFAFGGDAVVKGAPIGGPVTDLNVMIRRNYYHAQVRRVSGSITLASPTAFVVAECPILVRNIALDRYDALQLDEATGEELKIGSAGVLLIELGAGDDRRDAAGPQPTRI